MRIFAAEWRQFGLSFGGTVPFGKFDCRSLWTQLRCHCSLFQRNICGGSWCVFTLKQGPVIGEEILEGK
ncbi:MAG: hypothetical protein CM15mP49_34180 [Actinomycetota bacterium]|nr:MAG: hypothetical protein CM15mP49_34180 [Actinomycetota bacterium]